ncbi:kelch-like protein 10 [Uloborus diversus]|uniref:kelch-like protein 10 n=1 Tax=Uloborus diversus TaxID=327109 RepID=UPI002408F453|nr:kelch-like protein 10 [Uloborus diversus]
MTILVGFDYVYSRGKPNLAAVFRLCSGKTTVTSDNVNELLPAADQFNVLSMIDCCKKFLVDSLTPENCLGVWRFGKEYLMPDLEEAAKRYAILNFRKVMTDSEEMLELSPEALQILLQDDQLNIQGEYYVWIAIKRWCRFSYPDRLQYIPQMLKCYLSAVLLSDKIYAIGGYDGNNRLQTVECFDIKQKQWTYVSSMHQVRSDATASVLRNRIFVMGGFNGVEFLSSVECYYVEYDQWFLLPSMLSCRSGLGSAAYDNCIFAIGGFDGIKRLTTVEKYDLNSQLWFPAKPMQRPRSNFAVEILEDKIYVIGGYNDVDEVITDVCECYDLLKPKWKFVAPMGLARSGLSVCKVSEIQNLKDFIRFDKARCLVRETGSSAGDEVEERFRALRM